MRLIDADALLEELKNTYVPVSVKLIDLITNAPAIQRDGWVSVPIKPTEEMIKQGDIAQWGAYSHCTHIYKAMIQAAPTDKE